MLGECVDAVRYEGNACDRCTAGCETPPVSLVEMTAGMHCGAVTVVTPPQLSDVCLSVESLYELTLSLSRRCELCVINLFMFPSHAEKPPEATCSAHYRSIFEFSVTFPSILTFEILDMC